MRPDVSILRHSRGLSNAPATHGINGRRLCGLIWPVGRYQSQGVAVREARQKTKNKGALQADAADVFNATMTREREKKKREVAKLKIKALPRWPGFPLPS
jgi:hypothetical protein